MFPFPCSCTRAHPSCLHRWYTIFQTEHIIGRLRSACLKSKKDFNCSSDGVENSPGHQFSANFSVLLRLSQIPLRPDNKKLHSPRKIRTCVFVFGNWKPSKYSVRFIAISKSAGRIVWPKYNWLSKISEMILVVEEQQALERRVRCGLSRD